MFRERRLPLCRAEDAVLGWVRALAFLHAFPFGIGGLGDCDSQPYSVIECRLPGAGMGVLWLGLVGFGGFG